jgi:hypothetical protein
MRFFADFSNLARALEYRARMHEVAAGAAQAKLRREIMEMPMTHAGLDERVNAIALRLRAYTIADMPPPVDDLSLLIDVIAMRHGYTARAEAWRHIGINPDRGRGLLGRNAEAIDWPIWFVSFNAAFV